MHSRVQKSRHEADEKILPFAKLRAKFRMTADCHSEEPSVILRQVHLPKNLILRLPFYFSMENLLAHYQ